MNSVDKFGRSLRSGTGVGGSGGGTGGAGLRGPKGEGFVLDNDGNYLVSHKRIRQLSDPEDGTDAANKRWSESRILHIEDKLKAFEDDKKDLLNLWLQAMDQGQKSYDKAAAVESTLAGLSTRIKEIETKLMWQQQQQQRRR